MKHCYRRILASELSKEGRRQWWPASTIFVTVPSYNVRAPRVNNTVHSAKGLVHIKHFLGHTGCSMSCDCHDNSSFWHGNVSTALMHTQQYLAIVRCHMVSHASHMAWIWLAHRYSETSPRKHSICTSPFFWGWDLEMRLPLAGQKSRSLESANDTKSGE